MDEDNLELAASGLAGKYTVWILGPMIPWICPVKIKICAQRMQIRFSRSENTSWIRKYHKYYKMDGKIRNCDIFSTECKKLDEKLEIHKILRPW